MGRGGKLSGISSAPPEDDDEVASSSSSSSASSSSEVDREGAVLGEVSEAVGTEAEEVLGRASGRPDPDPLAPTPSPLNRVRVNRVDTLPDLVDDALGTSRPVSVVLNLRSTFSSPPFPLDGLASLSLDRESPSDRVRRSTLKDGLIGLGMVLGVDDAHNPDLRYCFPYDLGLVRAEDLVCLSVKRMVLTSSTDEGEPESGTAARVLGLVLPDPTALDVEGLVLTVVAVAVVDVELGMRREYEPLMSPGRVVIRRVLRVLDAIHIRPRPRPFLEYVATISVVSSS